MQLLNSAGWSKIYMHAVNADGDELSGVFPGIEVKEIFLDRIGRKVYIAVIPEEVTEIYFNDGGSNRTDVITDFNSFVNNSHFQMYALLEKVLLKQH